MIFADLNEDCNKVSENEGTEFEARKKFENISDLSQLQLNYLRENQNQPEIGINSKYISYSWLKRYENCSMEPSEKDLKVA